MKVLLLGANGQLGTDIQRVFTSHSGNGLKLIPFTRKELDIENVDSISDILSKQNFDVLINCTSYHKTDEVEDNASHAVTINAHAVEKMAESCEKQGARFVHISTDYVFSGTKRIPYTETDHPAPINVYGTSKYFGETLAQKACKNTYIIRVASLFGIAGASGKGGNFIETIIRIAKEKQELRIVDDIRMSPTSTKTIAEVLLALINSDAPPSIYHIVNSGDATWYEFGKSVMDKIGLNIPVHPVSSDEFPTRAHRPNYSVLNNSLVSETVNCDIPHWSDALYEYLSKKGYV